MKLTTSTATKLDLERYTMLWQKRIAAIDNGAQATGAKKVIRTKQAKTTKQAIRTATLT